MINIQAITTLAMLKVHADEQSEYYRDYIGLFLPFMNHAIKELGADQFTTDMVQNKLLQVFGLNVPLHAIDNILHRLVKKKYLERIKPGLYVIKIKLPDSDILGRKASLERRQFAILSKLQGFAKDKFLIDWDYEKTAEVFLRYIENFSIHCLKSYAKGSILPQITDKSEKDMIVVNTFVKTTIETSEEDFNNITTIVKGNMLANALLCPDLNNLSHKFTDIEFYFDTPLILGLLNLQGEYKYKTTTELMRLLCNLGGKVFIFEHTLVEIQNILTWCINNHGNSKMFNLILDEMYKRNKKLSDLVIVRDSLKDLLAKKLIRVKPAPAHDPKTEISEVDLGIALDNEIKYANDKAKEHDIDCIRSIFAYRNGHKAYTIEDAGFIFVTSNYGLAKIGGKFSLKDEDQAVPAIISDFELANIAWLKTPIESQLPDLGIIAACYAALEPKDALWLKYLKEIERLEQAGQFSPDDIYIMRSYKAKEELMEITLGDESLIGPEKINEIYNKVISQKLEVKNKEIHDKNDEISNEKNIRSQLQEELNGLKQRDMAVNSKLKKISSVCGDCAEQSIIFIAILFVSLVIGISCLPIATVFISKRIIVICTIILLVLNTYDMVWGSKPLKKYAKVSGNIVTTKVYQQLSKIFFEKPRLP